MTNTYIVTCDVLIRKKYYVAESTPEDAEKITYGMVAHEYRENALLEDSETLQIHVAHCDKEG
jgi:hypothetical protein